MEEENHSSQSQPPANWPPPPAVDRKVQFRTTSSRKAPRPLLVTIIAVLYFFNAGSETMGVFFSLLVPSELGMEMIAIGVLISAVSIGFYLAVGYGLWKTTRWSWWAISVIQPLSFGYSLAGSLLLLPSMLKSLEQITMDPTLAGEASVVSSFVIIGMGLQFLFSLTVTLVVLFVFWLNRDTFFGQNHEGGLTLLEYGGMALASLLAGAAAQILYMILLSALNGVSVQQMMMMLSDFSGYMP